MERCYNFSSFNCIAGISYSTDDMSLREAFGRYGEVLDGSFLSDLHNLLVFHRFRLRQYQTKNKFDL